MELQIRQDWCMVYARIMSANLFDTKSAVEDVKGDFLNVLHFYYRASFKAPWFYGVKLDECNKHSLASATGLTQAKLFITIQQFNLATMHKGQLRQVTSLERWTTGEMQEFFPSVEYLNTSSSPCIGLGRTKSVLFVRLGMDGEEGEEEGIRMPLPKTQKLDQEPPTYGCSSRSKRSLNALQVKLKKSVLHYQNLNSHQSCNSIEPVGHVPNTSNVEQEEISPLVTPEKTDGKPKKTDGNLELRKVGMATKMDMEAAFFGMERNDHLLAKFAMLDP